MKAWAFLTVEYPPKSLIVRMKTVEKSGRWYSEDQGAIEGGETAGLFERKEGLEKLDDGQIEGIAGGLIYYAGGRISGGSIFGKVPKGPLSPAPPEAGEYLERVVANRRS